MKKITTWILLVLIQIAMVEAAQETLPEADKKILVEASFREARKHLTGIYIIYVDTPKSTRPQRPQKPEMYEQAITYFSKNPKVREHYETFFKTTPHTIYTGMKRRSAFNDLGLLKAEWAIRLLGQELMIDRHNQQFRMDENTYLTDEQVLMIHENSEAGMLFRNDQGATFKLNKMNLRGMPTGVQYEALIIEMRKWYQENKHQLSEILVEKWGDKAVLDEKPEPVKQPLQADDQKEKTDVNSMSAKAIAIVMSIIGISTLSLVYLFFVKKKVK